MCLTPVAGLAKQPTCPKTVHFTAGGLTPAVYFGNMPPRSLEHATAAMEGSLCTTWKLNDVPSEQVHLSFSIGCDQLCPGLS